MSMYGTTSMILNDFQEFLLMYTCNQKKSATIASFHWNTSIDNTKTGLVLDKTYYTCLTWILCQGFKSTETVGTIFMYWPSLSSPKTNTNKKQHKKRNKRINGHKLSREGCFRTQIFTDQCYCFVMLRTICKDLPVLWICEFFDIFLLCKIHK